MTKSDGKAGGALQSNALKLLAGAATGALVILPLATWLKAQATFEAADFGALFVAALLILAGAATLLTTLDRRALAKALDPEAGERASLTSREFGLIRVQAVILLLAGVLLAAPPMLADSGIPTETAYAGLAAVFLIQTVANVMAWRASDSFNRRITMEGSALAFWTLQGALFLWAAAERMGLAQPVSAWTGVVILMAVYLLCSLWTSVRRLSA